MQKILITDTLFIFPEHEQKLRHAGFALTRLSGTMDESELIEAVKDTDGYILGGIEQVTEPVIAAANKLQVIAYTGADPFAYIPAYRAAAAKGIQITATPGANTYAVSELAMTLLLGMLRRMFEVGGPGDKKFIATQSLEEVRVGIVGMGRIGERMARLLTAFGAKEVWYWNRTRKPGLEAELGITYVPLEKLFKDCDVITNHLATIAGKVISRDLLERTKPGVLFVNAGGDSFDIDALYEQIVNHGARAAFDSAEMNDERFNALPLEVWYKTNEVSGYMTHAALKRASDVATASIINILQHGTDKYVVNA